MTRSQTQSPTDRRALPLQTRAAAVTGVADGSRTVNLVWSTGAPAKRFDFWTGTYYMEELSLDPAHVRLDRMNSGANLLNTHAQSDLSAVLGVVEPGSAAIVNGEGVCQVRFSERADVEPYFRDVSTGIIRNVSVGYIVHQYQKTDPPEGGGLPVWLAIDWEPAEVSLVSVPADFGAGVRSGMHGRQFPGEAQRSAVRAVGFRTFDCEFVSRSNLQEPSSMDNDNRNDPANNQAGSSSIQATIRGMLDIAKLGSTFEIDLISRNFSVSQARAAIFAELARRSEQAGPIRSAAALPEFGVGGQLDIGSPEGRADLYAEVIAARCGGPAPSEQARQFMNLRCVDMARDLLEVRGIRTTLMGPSAIVTRALHGIPDFPNLLSAAGNRVLRRAYESYQGGLRRACKPSTSRDFRPKQNLNLSEAPVLEKVNEFGEFKRTSKMSDVAESYTLGTFGKIFGITRQALVNDDLDAFGQMSAKFGTAAAEFESQTLVDLLASNPQLSDGYAVFHASHGNLGNVAALDTDALGAGRMAMRMQKGISGAIPIDVQARYVIVPAALELTLDKCLVPLPGLDQGVKANLFSGILEKIVDPRLDAYSTTTWYLSADPDLFDTIEYSYLEEQPGPQIYSRQGFDVDGMELKVALDFGCGFLDFRGLYKGRTA